MEGFIRLKLHQSLSLTVRRNIKGGTSALKNMHFPHEDPYWQSVADFLLGQFGEGCSIVAPTEFHELIPRTFPYDVIQHIDLKEMQALVIHKGALKEVGESTCALLVREGTPLFGNEVFVLFSLKGPLCPHPKGKEHFTDFYLKAKDPRTFSVNPVKLHSEFTGKATVILMTTYNRPDRLGLALESIAPLNAPILVVHDGSDAIHAAAYAAIFERYDVRVLNMPGNRGLSNALNAGLNYWLADPMVEWICYLQDDVEVRADLLVALARVQHPEKFPLLTGRRNGLHKVYGEKEVNGQKILLQRMSPGIHLHAHRSYWEKMLPIPTVYFQAPRRWPDLPARGADEDWWISQWSPNSIVKAGKYIAVLPDLVRTTTVLPAESTWGSPGTPEPLLPPPCYATDDFVAATFRSVTPKPSILSKPEPLHNFWEALAARFGQKAESEIHPHAPAECAELYHAIDSGSTELETLNFINALVCLFKPVKALETGTFLGYGTCAITAGLKSNRRGHLLTLEIDPVRLQWSRDHLHQFDPQLEERVTFVNESSLDFIARYQGEAFDFVFFDTEVEIRIQEFRLLRERNLFAPGAVCIIHDTSPHRPPIHDGAGGAADFHDRELLLSLGNDFEVFQFPRSRGFHLLRYCGEKSMPMK